MAAYERRACQETTLRHAGLQADRSKVQNALHAKDYIAQSAEGSKKGCQDRFVKAIRSISQATGLREFRTIRMISSRQENANIFVALLAQYYPLQGKLSLDNQNF